MAVIEDGLADSILTGSCRLTRAVRKLTALIARARGDYYLRSTRASRLFFKLGGCLLSELLERTRQWHAH